MSEDMENISREEAKGNGLKHYFTGEPCKHGHVSIRLVSTGQCCECITEYYKKNKNEIAKRKKNYYKQNKSKINEKSKNYYNEKKDTITNQRKEYRKQNKNKISNGMKEYYKQNKDELSERKKKYYSKNKEKIIDRNKAYRAKNKCKIADQKKEYSKAYYKQNPIPKLLRGALRRILTNWNGGRKKMEELHGYTFEQLEARIEFQFKDGMSWNNRNEWHIDHKKPISRFLEQGITDPKIINALSNLQPLWASDNLSKGAKFEI